VATENRLTEERELRRLQYHAYVIESVERGMQDAAEGRIIPHEKAAAYLRRKWLIASAQKSDPK
jgi:predicted transcriptional regulator